tara:strand:+ start:536 stop:817 length:282 start_codon:yes stop_codon:yes gene_type:complete
MDLQKAILQTHETVTSVWGKTKDMIVAKDKDNNEVNIDWTLIENWKDPDEYKMKRIKEYPPLDDCIHALLDGGDTLAELQAKRTAVKEKYPKE